MLLVRFGVTGVRPSIPSSVHSSVCPPVVRPSLGHSISQSFRNPFLSAYYRPPSPPTCLYTRYSICLSVPCLFVCLSVCVCVCVCVCLCRSVFMYRCVYVGVRCFRKQDELSQTNVPVVYDTRCPGYEVSWVRGVLGTSCPIPIILQVLFSKTLHLNYLQCTC